MTIIQKWKRKQKSPTQISRKTIWQQAGQISAKSVQGLPAWSLKRTLDFPKFLFRENKKNRFFAAPYPQQEYNT